MASPGQKQGLCGHLIAGLDSVVFCAHYINKGKGTDPCIKHENGQFCNLLTQDQKACLSTPSYQKKKEKHEQKAIQEELSSTLMDQALVSVLGVAKDRQDFNSEE